MTERVFINEIEDLLPDLIRSDYDLTKYNGALAFAEAGRRCPGTPFILEPVLSMNTVLSKTHGRGMDGNLKEDPERISTPR
jgi:hypothetical protein